MAEELKKQAKGRWSTHRLLSAATALVVVAGIVAYLCIGDAKTAGAVGDFASAIAGTLAFLWLVAGYYLQQRELRLQRRELTLQRRAVALQAEEMHRLAEQATLGQMATMLDRFNAGIPGHRVERVESIHDIPVQFGAALGNAKGVLSQRDVNERYAHYRRWMQCEGLAMQLLNVMLSAVRLYSANVPNVRLVEKKTAAETILANSALLSTVPHVQLFIQPATIVAQFFVTSPAFVLRVRLAGTEAMAAVLPGTMRPEAIPALREELKQFGPDAGKEPGS